MSTGSQAELVAVLLSLAKALNVPDAEVSRPDAQPAAAPPDEKRPALISVPEAAVMLGISRASAYRYAAAGHLPVKRFGRRVYVIRTRLADFTIPDPAKEDDAA